MKRENDSHKIEARNGFVFEVNPLIAQVVLWNEAEILDARPEFTKLDHVNRIAEICKQLFFRDVAQVEFQSPPVWVPTDRIESNSGGSNIVACSRYELATSISSEERRILKAAIGRQFRWRLNFIVKECILEFETYNFGLTKIEGVDDKGLLRWCLTDA